MRRGKEIASLPSSFLPPLLLRQLEPVSLPSFRMTTGGGGRLSARPSVRPSSEFQKFQTSIFLLFLQGQSDDLTEFLEQTYACNNNSVSSATLIML